MRLEKSKYKWLERGWRLTKPPVDKEVYRTLLYSYHMKIKTAHKVLHNLNKRQNWKFHKKTLQSSEQVCKTSSLYSYYSGLTQNYVILRLTFYKKKLTLFIRLFL